MILINFSHPLTAEQREQIETLVGQSIARTIERQAQFDLSWPLEGQVANLVDSVGLSATEWRNDPLLLVLPGLNFGTAVLLAELHGRCGYFPDIVRTRLVPDSMPPKFEVADIIRLDEVASYASEVAYEAMDKAAKAAEEFEEALQMSQEVIDMPHSGGPYMVCRCDGFSAATEGQTIDMLQKLYPDMDIRDGLCYVNDAGGTTQASEGEHFPLPPQVGKFNGMPYVVSQNGEFHFNVDDPEDIRMLLRRFDTAGEPYTIWGRRYAAFVPK